MMDAGPVFDSISVKSLDGKRRLPKECSGTIRQRTANSATHFDIKKVLGCLRVILLRLQRSS
jgi:hypothetical protein